MPQKRRGGMTRRQFAKMTGAGAAAAGLGANFLFPARAAAQQKTLKILQWSHFVPGYDKWFDNTYTKEWGARRTTRTSSSITSRSARSTPAPPPKWPPGRATTSSCSSRRRPPTRSRSIDHREIYEAVEKKHGKKIELAEKSTFNPKTKTLLRLLGFLRSRSGQLPQGPLGEGRIPQRAGHVGRPARRRQEDQGPVRQPGRRRALPGARHEHGHAGAPLVLRRRGAGRDGNVTIYSPQTIEAIKYMRDALQGDGDARGLHVGSLLQQPGDPRGQAVVRRQRDLGHALGREGQPGHVGQDLPDPGAQGAGPPHRGRARDGLLRGLGLRREQGRRQAVPRGLHGQLRRRVQGERVLQLPVLPLDGARTSPSSSRTTRRPIRRTSTRCSPTSSTGPPTSGTPATPRPAIDEVFNTFVIPTMFAKAAQDVMSPEESARAAEKEIKRIFDKWK